MRAELDKWQCFEISVLLTESQALLLTISHTVWHYVRSCHVNIWHTDQISYSETPWHALSLLWYGHAFSNISILVHQSWTHHCGSLLSVSFVYSVHWHACWINLHWVFYVFVTEILSLNLKGIDSILETFPWRCLLLAITLKPWYDKPYITKYWL